MAERKRPQKNQAPARMYDSARTSGRRFSSGRRPLKPLLVLALSLVVLVAALVIALRWWRAPADVPAMQSGTVAPTEQAPAIGLAALVADEPALGAAFGEGFGEDAPIDDGSEGGEGVTDDSYRADEVVGTRPTASPGGYLPIFSKAKTDEKIIAITVDDCNQTQNLDRIVDCAVENDALLTIFPIGKNLSRAGLQQVVRRAHSLGMQFENHSYSHEAFYRLSADEMAREIYDANRALNYVLGIDYQMRFMRTRGGDNRRDLRTHQYIDKLGYVGMAHWSMNGSNTAVDKLKSTIEPGNIYLFHTTDSDLKTLLEFIPYAREQGYRMVTLNEMFGYPANAEREIATPLKELDVPAPDPYVYAYKQLEPRDYLWDVYLAQQRLIELGWLDGAADGVYGKGTYMAVGYFQLAVGEKATGRATPETQQRLFADDAPRSADGKAAIGASGPAGTPGMSGTSGPPGSATPIPTSPVRVTLEPDAEA